MREPFTDAAAVSLSFRAPGFAASGFDAIPALALHGVMPAAKLSFRFTAPLVRVEQGMLYHALPVPDEIAAAWKQAKIRRLVGQINGHPVKRALQSHADGGSFVIVSRDFMKTAGIGPRAEATLELKPDPTPEQLDLPEEFQIALRQDPTARQRWDTFTTGRQRSLLIYITGAKTEPTRIKRSVELVTKIGKHQLYGDKPRSS